MRRRGRVLVFNECGGAIGFVPHTKVNFFFWMMMMQCECGGVYSTYVKMGSRLPFFFNSYAEHDSCLATLNVKSFIIQLY